MMRVSKSVVGEMEKEAVMNVLSRGYLGMGSEVQSFEEEIKKYLGGDVHVACVNTGTAAIHLALQAIGLGLGDEVLIPTLTYVATFQAASATGAKPIACEVSNDTGLIDLKKAESRISARTKAILPVHYASDTGDLDAVYSFAKKHGLRVVEDAAHAFGGEYKGRKVGSFGDVVCFSFDGIKNITSGEGGAIATQDSKVINRIRDARLLGVMGDTDKRYQGMRSWEFDVTEQGWRYHMSDIMAAIGRVQLKRFEIEFKPKRQALLRQYRSQLEGCPSVLLFKQSNSNIVPHILPIRVLGGQRDKVRTALLQADIQTGIHYKPNHLLSLYREQELQFPIAEKIYEEILTLPLHPEIEEQDVERVVTIIRQTLK